MMKCVRNVAPFTERAREWAPDMALFGSVLEATEFMVRSIGQKNMLLWMGLYPEDIGRFAQRINEYSVQLVKGQVQSAGGMLDGFLIAGDVAYGKGLFFSPAYWRRYFKPGLAEIIATIHAYGLPVIYHGCGNVRGDTP